MGRKPVNLLWEFDRYYPWLRGPNEDDMAFRAFSIYRKMGNNGKGRTMNELNSILRGDKSYDPKKRAFNRVTMEWAKKYHWEARCVAWDNRIEKVKDSVLVSDAKKWEKRRIASIVKNWHSVKSLRKKVEEMLKFPVYETRESRDGQIVVTKPLKWGISDVAAMLKTVIELETAIFEAVCNRPDNEITEGEKNAIAEVQFEKELKKIEDAISRETTDHASDDANANDSPHGEQIPGGTEGETGGTGVEPES